MSEEILAHFPTCKELKDTLIEQSFAKYVSHLNLLSKEFNARFSDFSLYEDQFQMFSAPFSFDAGKAEESLQMELLEIQSNSILKEKYLEVGIPEFFSYIPENFKTYRMFVSRIMAMFGSTYLCEQLFSFMKLTKNAHRTRLTDANLSSLVKVGTAQEIQPDLSKLTTNKRCQRSGQS